MSGKNGFQVARARVVNARHISPGFVRIRFGGPELQCIGTPGATFDQRIKLIFPSPGGALPAITGGDSWYQDWLALPDEVRGVMRTYSLRAVDVLGDSTGERTEITVDFVAHLAEGLTGPAAQWAEAARPGDELVLIGPPRGLADNAGIEFRPGGATHVVLAGDETAAPAIARILEDAPRELTGVAFIEVPSAADVLPIAAPAGVRVEWLPRSAPDASATLPHGGRLIPAVLGYCGHSTAPGAPPAEYPECGAATSDELLWETPTFSGLGEQTATAPNRHEWYYWVAAESGVATTLRRHLVRDLDVDHTQVAFMGYWKRGVAMRG